MNHKRVSIQDGLAGCRICAADIDRKMEAVDKYFNVGHDKDVIKGRLREVLGE